MRYIRFEIEKYKGIKSSRIPILSDPIPVIGINESGKSSVMEALAHFDYRNDPMADSKKWKFYNRYSPQENEFKVTAVFTYETAEMEGILNKFAEPEKSTLTSLLPQDKFELTFDRIFRKNNPTNPRLYRIFDKEDDLMQRFCKELINLLPRIFYFDNFLENPFPNYVSMPADYLTNPAVILNQDQYAIEKMFGSAGYPLKEILSYTDPNDQITCIGEVNKYVNKMLIEDWDKMKLGAEELDIASVKSITLELQLSNTIANTINIKIKESFKMENQPPFIATLDLDERSLGFRWFFNFTVKKFFGAKDNEQIIYLFDEPGSFLHNSAQKILLDAIKDLAKTHPVVFTTHSEFLLDPEKININNIRVVEKEKREIKLVPYAEAKHEKNLGALSTLFNALRVSLPINNTLKQKVIVTEGLTDFYFWRMLSNDFVFLPGHGAGQNSFLISMAIGTSEKYVALFDGDEAGDQAIILYKTHFNDEEARNWKQYKNSTGKCIKLEKIFSKDDQDRLKQIASVTDLKKALTWLFYSNKKDEFWSSITEETKQNIKVNLEMILDTLSLPKNTTLKYSL